MAKRLVIVLIAVIWIQAAAAAPHASQRQTASKRPACGRERASECRRAGTLRPLPVGSGLRCRAAAGPSDGADRRVP